MSRRISSRTLSFRPMSGNEEIDGSRPATLDNGAVSTDFPTLQAAISPAADLRPEQAQRASRTIIGGQLYAAVDIPKLLNGLGLRPAPDIFLAVSLFERTVS